MQQDEWSKIAQCVRCTGRIIIRWLPHLVQLPSSSDATQSTTAAGLVGLKSQPQSLKSHLEMTADESKHEAAESVKWTLRRGGVIPGGGGAGPIAPSSEASTGDRWPSNCLDACPYIRAAPWPGMASSGLRGLFMQPNATGGLASTSHSIAEVSWLSHLT